MVPARPSTTRTAAKVRLLLAHKSARVRSAFSQSFRRYPLAVCVTAPGEAFVQAARRFNPDAVVTDDAAAALEEGARCAVTWMHTTAFDRLAAVPDPAAAILEMLQADPLARTWS
jgi:hypothetical protein